MKRDEDFSFAISINQADDVSQDYSHVFCQFKWVLGPFFTQNQIYFKNYGYITFIDLAWNEEKNGYKRKW